MMLHIFCVRHGQSFANVNEVIVSHENEGPKSEYGLTSVGRDQAMKAGEALVSFQPIHKGGIIILASPFSRALQTAEAVYSYMLSECLSPQFHVEPLLRERWFGEFDATHNSNYKTVWLADAAEGSHHRMYGVESIRDVVVRVLDVIDLHGRNVKGSASLVLVSHGDTLQIIQAALAGLPPHQHRSLQPLENGEVRYIFKGTLEDARRTATAHLGEARA
mmetsp:Transcript_11835/g.29896  ORF Transcript_11835/g.29896 Transcript_11835/m.29896 type:complete len:219 (+) Transcript_11835:125-781(+)